MAEITFLDEDATGSLEIYHRKNQVTLDLFPHHSHSYSIHYDPTVNRELGLGLGFSIESTDLCDLDDDVADYPSGFLPSDPADRFFPDPVESSSTIPFVKLDTFLDEEIQSSIGIDFVFCFEDRIRGDERERADGMVDEREEMSMFFGAYDVAADCSSGFLPSDCVDRVFPDPVESSTIPFVKLDTCLDEEIESSMGIDFGFCFEAGIRGDEGERADGMVDEREAMSMFFGAERDEGFEWDEREGMSIFSGADVDDDMDAPVAMEEEMGIEQIGNLDWENVSNFHGIMDSLDEIMGDDFEILREQLAEDEDNVRNPPAASRSAVENLTAVVVTEADVDGGDATCAICWDDMVVGEKAKALPCSHRYHWCCIDPWLRMRNTCPVCRYELPTDDSEYERRRSERGFL